MKKKLFEHIISIIFVGFIFFALYFTYFSNKTDINKINKHPFPEEFKVNYIDFENPIHNSILKETLNIFYSGKIADSLFLKYEEQFKTESRLSGQISGSVITHKSILELVIMFMKFVLVYIIVLALTYYGVQTLAVYRFIISKQYKPPLLIRFINKIKSLKRGLPLVEGLKITFDSLFLIIKAILKIFAYFVLFSPAYVIAYSFKTKFDTDSILFMILLGIISNALLITYSQKFYTFLVSESNKGYVETAIIKNLNNNYEFSSLKISSLFNFKKHFPNHVFNHIFINAQNQYYSTVKEQAAFLISGLIIIEMALNIHGHLGYNLMQNLLYKKYTLVLIAIFFIYLLVKATEIFVDIFTNKINKMYQNK